MTSNRTSRRTSLIAIVADLAFVAAATLLTHQATAQHQPRASQRTEKNSVVVQATTQTSDIIGKMLVSDLLDDIARSPRYQQANEENEKFGMSLTVHLVTDDAADHTQTNVAEVITINNYYISSAVIHCPAVKIAECAHEILPDFDAVLQSINAELTRQNQQPQLTLPPAQ